MSAPSTCWVLGSTSHAKLTAGACYVHDERVAQYQVVALPSAHAHIGQPPRDPAPCIPSIADSSVPMHSAHAQKHTPGHSDREFVPGVGARDGLGGHEGRGEESNLAAHGDGSRLAKTLVRTTMPILPGHATCEPSRAGINRRFKQGYDSLPKATQAGRSPSCTSLPICWEIAAQELSRKVFEAGRPALPS